MGGGGEGWGGGWLKHTCIPVSVTFFLSTRRGCEAFETSPRDQCNFTMAIQNIHNRVKVWISNDISPTANNSLICRFVMFEGDTMLYVLYRHFS